MESQVILKINDIPLTDAIVTIFLKTNGEYKKAINELIKTVVLKSYAAKSNITVSDEELTEKVNSKRKKLKLYKVEDTNKYLAKIGINSDQWIDSIEDGLLKNKIKNIAITGDQAKEHFEENKFKFNSISLFKISVENEDKADEILMEARDDGKGFSELAYKYSTDPDTAPAYGYMGLIKRGGLQLDLEGKVFSANEGAIIGPVKDGESFSIYKIGKIIRPDFEEVKEEIIDGLFEIWVTNLIHSAKID